MKFIVCFIIIISINNSWATTNCCSSEDMLLNSMEQCWDPQSNAISATKLTCDEPYRLEYTGFFAVNDDEDLVYSYGEGLEETISNAEFCIGKVSLKNESRALLLCIEEEEQIDYQGSIVYCLIVSIIFLVLTTFIYSALPELRDIQGKSIINFCGSLATAKMLIIILNSSNVNLESPLCSATAISAHFFFMAAMFWTNAIAVYPLKRASSTDYSWHAFKWYFVYAWGSPTFLTVCMSIVNYIPGEHAKPGFGTYNCWFINKTQQWLYMYGIMSLLLAANGLIFIYTWVILSRQPSSSGLARSLKYKFVMTVRLIILMGLPWALEIITGSAQSFKFWVVIADLFTSLQGLVIFLLLVVFRRRVIKHMYYHGWLRCISGVVEKFLAVADDEEQVVEPDDPLALGDKSTP